MARPRILLLPWLHAGHATPFGVLAGELNGAGADVLVLGDQAAADAAASAGAAAGAGVVPERAIEALAVLRGAAAAVLLGEIARVAAADLIHRCAEVSPDLVIVDPFHAGAIAAMQAVDLPWAVVGVAPEVATPRFAGSTFARVAARLLGVETLAALPNPPIAHLAAWLPAFDPPGCTWGAREHIGHLTWSRAPRDEAVRDLDGHFVLVTGTTVPDGARARYASFLGAAIRVARAAGFSVVATGVAASDADVTGARWLGHAPHRAIIPYCRAVISHGGWGGIALSIDHGRPMAIAPVGGDQRLNAELCTSQGVALLLGEREAQARADEFATWLEDPRTEARLHEHQACATTTRAARTHRLHDLVAAAR